MEVDECPASHALRALNSKDAMLLDNGRARRVLHLEVTVFQERKLVAFATLVLKCKEQCIMHLCAVLATSEWRLQAIALAALEA